MNYIKIIEEKSAPFSSKSWKAGKLVKGARLETVYSGNTIEVSNLSMRHKLVILFNTNLIKMSLVTLRSHFNDCKY